MSPIRNLFVVLALWVLMFCFYGMLCLALDLDKLLTYYIDPIYYN